MRNDCMMCTRENLHVLLTTGSPLGERQKHVNIIFIPHHTTPYSPYNVEHDYQYHKCFLINTGGRGVPHPLCKAQKCFSKDFVKATVTVTKVMIVPSCFVFIPLPSLSYNCYVYRLADRFEVFVVNCTVQCPRQREVNKNCNQSKSNLLSPMKSSCDKIFKLIEDIFSPVENGFQTLFSSQR